MHACRVYIVFSFVAAFLCCFVQCRMSVLPLPAAIVAPPRASPTPSRAGIHVFQVALILPVLRGTNVPNMGRIYSAQVMTVQLAACCNTFIINVAQCPQRMSACGHNLCIVLSGQFRGVAAGLAGPAKAGPLFLTRCEKCPQCRILHPNFKISPWDNPPPPPRNPSGRTTSNGNATRLQFQTANIKTVTAIVVVVVSITQVQKPSCQDHKVVGLAITFGILSSG